MQQRILLSIANVVLALRIDKCQARLDRREFVGADATVDDFLHACGAVEALAPVTLNDGERERPFVPSDFERGHALDTGIELMRCRVRLQEPLARVLVLHRVA